MVKVEDIQNYGKEHLETVAASASNLQSGVQAIATAYGDYAKKSFEDTKSFVEKLSGVKSLDKAMEAQTEYRPLGLRDLRCGVAEDRRPLQRSRQADLQALSRAWSRSSPRPRASTIQRERLAKAKSPAVMAGLFRVPGPDLFRHAQLGDLREDILERVGCLIGARDHLGSRHLGVAQFFSTSDSGSLLSMLTWIVNTVTGLVLVSP